MMMLKKRLKGVSICICIVLLTASCVSYQTEPSVEQDVIVTFTQTVPPKSTDTPRPTSTRRPTFTPHPTNTPTIPPTIVPVQIAEWDGVSLESVCLNLQIQYEKTITGDIENPPMMEEEIRQILQGIGIQILDPDEKCDASLTVEFLMNARGAEYSGNRYLFTGAIADGTLTLEAESYPLTTIEFSYNYPPPFTLVGKLPASKNQAPFHRAALPAVLEGLSKTWGPQILFQVFREDTGFLEADAYELMELDTVLLALRETDPKVREAVAQESWHKFDDKEGSWKAIPDLFTIIENEPEGKVRKYLFLTLQTLTGQDIGRDLDAWKAWWNEQQ
jgi:hypothetical protein